MAAGTAIEGTGQSEGHATLIAILTVLAGITALAISPTAFSLVIVGFVPLAALLCIRQPILLCMLFVAFSFFRIHEAYPSLAPLSLPQGLGIMMTASLVIHAFLLGTIKPQLHTTLIWLAALVGLVLFGLIFAKNRELSWEFFSIVYWKIILVTLAIAWLARTQADFITIARVLVISGALVSCVAIYNKIYGLSLVEGTRVSIARPELAPGASLWNLDTRNVSTLADPNDLALILLFPLAFSIALVVSRTKPIDRLIGMAGTIVTMPAVIFTQSRGGLLGMVAVLGIVGLQKIKSKSIVIALSVIAAIGLAVMMGLSDRVSGGAAELSESGIDESARGRIVAWQAAINMMIANPLSGVGIQGFADAFYIYTSEWLHMNKAVHSTWFQIIGEMGFPGIIVFVGLYVSTVGHARALLHRLTSTDADPIMQSTALALLCGLVGFGVSGTFLTQAFTWPLYILIALTVALSLVTANIEANAAIPASAPPAAKPDQTTAARPIPLKMTTRFTRHTITPTQTTAPAPSTPRGLLNRHRPAAIFKQRDTSQYRRLKTRSTDVSNNSPTSASAEPRLKMQRPDARLRTKGDQ